jgi:hypothetical protein
MVSVFTELDAFGVRFGLRELLDNSYIGIPVSMLMSIYAALRLLIANSFNYAVITCIIFLVTFIGYEGDDSQKDTGVLD